MVRRFGLKMCSISLLDSVLHYASITSQENKNKAICLPGWLLINGLEETDSRVSMGGSDVEKALAGQVRGGARVVLR
jgi:hypothetical protein